MPNRLRSMKRYLTAIIIVLAALTCAAGADTFDCDSCTDCSQKIQSANAGDVVRLTVDITDCDGSCIEFNGTDGVTFDSGDHVIDGGGDFDGYGIYLSSYSNNNILKNCEITGFRGGIYLFTASYNTLQNITAYSNRGSGVTILYGTDNTIRDCILQENQYYDFHFRPDLLIDCDNTLINVTGSGNRPIAFYNQSVNLQDQIFSSLCLCNADNSVLNNITIAGSDSRKNNGIRLYYTDDSNLTNIVSSDNSDGIDLDRSNSNNLQNITCINNHNDGIFVSYCSYNTLENTLTNSSSQSGIYLYHSPYNVLTNITSSYNFYSGVHIDTSSSTTISNSYITDNFIGGIAVNSAGMNLIYNNYFSNTDNANFVGTIHANDWNVTNTTGPNIVGKPYIGGNYWSDYKGMDNNSDGFGDTSYNVNGTGESNIDYLPLVYAPATCGDITGDGTIDTVDLLLLLEYVVKGTPVDACIGDIDGNGHINSLDVLLLMGYINNPTGYSLHCGC